MSAYLCPICRLTHPHTNRGAASYTLTKAGYLYLATMRAEQHRRDLMREVAQP